VISEGVDHEGDVVKTLPCKHVSKVAHHEHVGRRGTELVVQLVLRTWGGRVAVRCFYDISSHLTEQSNLFHQPGHSAFGHIEGVTVQLMQGFAHAVDLEVCVPDTLNFLTQN
jgi:hypothetical protein